MTMKNTRLARATLAGAALLLLSFAYAQSPMDLLRQAAEAAAKLEQTKPPPPPPQSASPAQPSAAVLSPAPQKSAVATPSPSGSPSAAALAASGMQNPEVQMLLTSSRPSSWADAQKKAVTKVRDGDPLWIYLKADKPFKEYVYHNEDDPKTSTGQLMLVIAPRGTYTSVLQRHRGRDNSWPLRLEEMRATEIAIGLSPFATRSFQLPGATSAKSGRASFFLEFVAGPNADPGVWENEIFVVGSRQLVDAQGRVDPTIERAMALAVAPITIDVSTSYKKYMAQREEDCSNHPGGKPCRGKQ